MTYVDTTDIAKMIRVELRRQFPGQRFNVRTDIYSGGASIRVTWKDGPTPAEVDPIVKPYAGASFDGQTDTTDHLTSTVRDTFGNTVTIRSGADHVFTRRDLTPEFRMKLRSLAIGIIEKSDHPEGHHFPYGEHITTPFGDWHTHWLHVDTLVDWLAIHAPAA